MACCRKKNEADLRSAAIDRELKEMNREDRSEIKLLLLGPGDSGKSTLVKQVKILHTNGFNDIERQSYRPIIYSNIVFNIKSLCVAATTFGYKLQKNAKKSARHLVDAFFIFPEDEPLGETIVFVKQSSSGSDIMLVWADEAIQQTFKRRNEFTMMDSAKYYFENMDRIGKNDYIPSDEDVLRSRQRTRGIIETTYQHKNSKFRLVDVGGQRNERGKWIHCFEQVTAIIYCASLIEYNQTLEENPAVNRMMESLNLWDGICRYRWFYETAFILFLNKVDLFEEKILMVSLKVLFPDFVDSKDPKLQIQNGLEFVRNQYLCRKLLENRVVNAHFTCATDTKKINIVFDAVYEHLLARRLADAYIL